MLSWMPVLEKRIDAIGDGSVEADPEFRLWLSSNPDPKFPITILLEKYSAKIIQTNQIV